MSVNYGGTRYVITAGYWASMEKPQAGFQVGHVVLWRKSQIATYQLTSNKLRNVPVPQFPRL